MQIVLLGADKKLKNEVLSGTFYFDAEMRRICREDQHMELRRPFDKAHDGIHTMPTRDELQQLYNQWWGCKDRLQTHVSLMNL